MEKPKPLSIDELKFASMCIAELAEDIKYNQSYTFKMSLDILRDIYLKLARKMLTNMPVKGYKVKLAEKEKNCLFYLKNELKLKSEVNEWDVALSRVIEVDQNG